nr:hypothetical protein [Tanacetum cinerariifolium]
VRNEDDKKDVNENKARVNKGHKTISCGNNCGVDVIDFDDFDNGDESDDEHQLNNINIRLKQIRRAYKGNVEARRDLKVLKCGKRKVRATCFSIVVGYVKGKDGPKKSLPHLPKTVTFHPHQTIGAKLRKARKEKV